MERRQVGRRRQRTLRGDQAGDDSRAPRLVSPSADMMRVVMSHVRVTFSGYFPHSEVGSLWPAWGGRLSGRMARGSAASSELAVALNTLD